MRPVLGISCRGKSRFATRNQAEKACKRMVRQYDEGLHPYRCPGCGQYHIGAAPRKARKE